MLNVHIQGQQRNQHNIGKKKPIIENTPAWYAYHTRILILASTILCGMEILSNVVVRCFLTSRGKKHALFTLVASLLCFSVVKERNKKRVIRQVIIKSAASLTLTGRDRSDLSPPYEGEEFFKRDT